MKPGDDCRAAEIEAFLSAAGWSGATRRFLAGDVSPRRYFRLAGPEGSAVLMNVLPTQLDIGPYLTMTDHLAGLGVSVPRVLAAAPAQGLALLEDFGDTTFTRALAAGAPVAPLYRLAVDRLIALHRRPRAEMLPAGLPAYDQALLLRELSVFAQWWLPEALGTRHAAEVTPRFLALWQDVLARLPGTAPFLVLRDFHVDNLMDLSDRPGLARCGVLDFQDAVAGNRVYDLVSLLRDARYELPETLVAEMRQRYLDAFETLDRSDFETSWAILNVQRSLKILGIFARVYRRDGHPGYLRHLARCWRQIARDLDHGALAPVKAWLAASVPAELRAAPPGLAEAGG